MAEYPVLHGPQRPDWTCLACGEQWPCPTRKQQLRELCRTPQRLAVYLTQYLPDAVDDLGRMSVADVTERIVGWCTRPGEGPAPSARPRRPRWPRRSI